MVEKKKILNTTWASPPAAVLIGLITGAFFHGLITILCNLKAKKKSVYKTLLLNRLMIKKQSEVKGGCFGHHLHHLS
jgi:hypothetical protein